MKKINKFILLSLFAAVAVAAASSKSYAVPAFARQMGVECKSCHYQQFPLLNQFGREFKAGGYIMGNQPHVEGEKMSLPNVLNASLVTKVRYQKTNGGDDKKATNYGELQFPDEAALLIGGQAGTNIGFLLEAQLADPDAPTFASYKMPIVYDVAASKLSVIPFSTDGLGASFGFELLNTGAVRNNRLTEHRKEVSAQQYLGTDGAATGFAFVAYHDTGYVNYSLWKPVHGSSSASFLNYLRVAATPQVAGWDLGVGGQLWSGTSTDETTAPNTEEKADAWAIDAQAQGTVASMPLGVYLTYGSVGKDSTLQKADSKAATIAAELSVLPSTQVSIALRRAETTGKSDNAIALGVKYLLAQNVQLSLNHSIYSGDAYDPKPGTGDQLSTLMIFAAF